MKPPSQSRRTHRRRSSALLSLDTTATLPEYIQSPDWRHHRRSEEENVPSDKPPDYPDSAEEADEDTDTDLHSIVYVPHYPQVPGSALSSPSGSRKPRKAPVHRRRHSTTFQGSQSQPADPFLDSLLERSVHALEMSNNLLQSSMSTQESLSNIFATNNQDDHTLETRTKALSSRITDNWDTQATWANDLEEISRGVDGLFNEAGQGHSRRHSGHMNGEISSSLPASMSPLHNMKTRRRPSLDFRQTSPRLRLSQQERSQLVSPPPRALTQYVASTNGSEPSILLPSTLGLRSPSSFHITSDWRPLAEGASASTSNLHASPSLPRVIDKPLEPSTPAYNMLSSFVHRHTPSPASSTPSTSRSLTIRGSSNSTERGSTSSRRSTSPRSSHKSKDKYPADSKSGAARCSRSQTPKCVNGFANRAMTPPLEESSSSSDSCVGKRTILSLRKILDDQPPPQASISEVRPKAPAFLPLTPAPTPETVTSTATASISRLFTKGKHSSSSRASSPPRQSAMKQATPIVSPSPSPTTLSIPDLLFGSASSSGRSTPKRISFAQLPESYASTRPEGSLSGFKKNKKKRGDAKRRVGPGENGEGGRWWHGWLGSGGAGPFGLGMAIARNEERAEDRMSRSWGGRMGTAFGSGVDEWAV